MMTSLRSRLHHGQNARKRSNPRCYQRWLASSQTGENHQAEKFEKLPELIVAGEFPFSSVVPHPAIQHAFPPVSAAFGKQAALTQPSPHALHL